MKLRIGNLAVVMVLLVGMLAAWGSPALAAQPQAVTAAVDLSTTPATQNFNSLASTGTAIPWTNDVTIAGWHSNRTTYNTGTGSSNTGALYSFGASGSTERALGSLASGGTGTVYYGVSLVNNTGSVVTALEIAYTGEQWRDGGNNPAVPQTLTFQYQVGATSLTTGTWTNFSSLDFTSPTYTTVAGALDGNASANRRALSATLTGLSVANGQQIWLRWTDVDHPGNDHGLAVDDFSVNIPGGPVPSVSSTLPADGATDVALDANITVDFSEDVTLSSGWYSLSCAASGLHPAAVSGSGASYTLDPDTQFSSGEVCTLTIDKDLVLDGDSNPMAADYVTTFTVTAPAACSQPFISEYVEGSGYNKAIEIYNGSSSTLDLSQYKLELYTNGAAVPSQSLTLSGSLPPGAVYVLAHGSADVAITSIADVLNSTLINFNGDDAVALRLADNTPLDIIGQIGVDPGTQWGSAPTSTLDSTLRRKTTISGGDTDGGDAFVPALEWDGYALNTFDGLGAHTSTCDTGGDAAPGVLSTTPADGSGNVPVDSNLVIDFSESVSLSSGWYAIDCATSGLHTAAVTGSGSSYTLDPDVDFAYPESCTVTVYAAQVADDDSDDPPDAPLADYAFTFNTGTPTAPCSTIPLIQGVDDISTCQVAVSNIQGCVTYLMADGRGFFMQATGGGDGNAATSDGIFVYQAANPAWVAPGRLVTASGNVIEYYGLTEFSSLTSLVDNGACSITPTALDLPAPLGGSLEPYEGMLVTVPETLTVSQNYFLHIFGQLTLSADGRMYNPYNGNGFGDTLESNLRRMLVLDDGRSAWYPNPAPYYTVGGVPTDGAIRAGDSVANLTGVLDYGRINASTPAANHYRLHPTDVPSFTSGNPRPPSPDATHGTLKVAGFNVLNYFNGPVFPTSRGATTDVEFDRQRDKIIDALCTLNADVVGLMEIENDGVDAASALYDLVAGLNASSVCSANGAAYALVDDSAVPNARTDEIRVALIYKTNTVSLVAGSVSNYQVASFTYNSITYAPLYDRPPLYARFRETASNEDFWVVVNHFKSKRCTDATGLDADITYGCYNNKRTAQADRLVALASTLAASGEPDVLFLGDYNAYTEEPPMLLLTGATGNLVDLAHSFVPAAQRYSYIFDGAAGDLDHVLATASMAAQATGATIWHINTDEPPLIDYNLEDKYPDLYLAHAYRSSDHDPVVVGLYLPYGLADLSDLPAGYAVSAHRAPHSLWLGAAVDDDLDYGEGSDNGSDDGISLLGSWLPGAAVQMQVTVSGAGTGWLSAWLDWDNSGALDADERVYNAQVTPGLVTIDLTVPDDGSYTTGRLLVGAVRLYESASEPALLLPQPSAANEDTPAGIEQGGEVESHTFFFTPTALNVVRFQAAAHAHAPWSFSPWGVLALIGLALGMEPLRRKAR